MKWSNDIEKQTRRYAKKLIASQFSGQRDLVDDLVQDTVIRVYRFSDGVDEKRLERYVMRAAANICNDYRRHLSRRILEAELMDVCGNGDTIYDATGSGDVSAEEEMIARVSIEEYRKLVFKACSKRHAELFWARVALGMSYPDISVKYKITQQAARTSVHRANKEIQDYLEKQNEGTH